MKLTIFTPTYNRKALLKRVYESLLKQSCKAFEWLIVDDGSTDDTKSVVEQWIAEKKIPVHVVNKKIPYMNEKGETVKPDVINGHKFETLVVDMIHLLENCLPFEVVREKEFAPIKNATGTDSVESARELLRKNNVEL